MLRALALSLWLFLPALAFAYNYPYQDPYYATMTTAILKADHLDHSARYQDFKLSLLPERSSVPFYGASRNYLKLRLWPGKPGAPLIVMVAGLGGAASSSYYNYLGWLFQKRGYSALAVPSPFHWSFALAASRSGFPGVTRSDAEDLYQVIEKGITLTQEKGGLEPGKVGLLGVSMGALEAAYLSEIDAKADGLFGRILLVNPPVTPLESALALDALAAEGKDFSPAEKKNLQENVYLFGIKAMAMSDVKDPAYFLHLEEKMPTTLAERKFLIGSSLREFLEALVFTTQQVHDLGVLKNPVATSDPDARLRESRGFSYLDYMKKFLLPGLSQENGKPVRYEDVAGDVNMSGVEAHLRADERVFLMHNADDFIVKPEDLKHLQSVFGARMRLYPHGGHMGNLWFPENLGTIFEIFSALER